MYRKIKFTKMHGAGNDYIYIDATRFTIPDPARAARLWSDRHFGIGSDGLVLVGRPDPAVADFSMRLFNADGSEALMCGNASRCVGKLVWEMGMTRSRSLRLSTLSGVKHLNLTVDPNGELTNVAVDMLEPVLADTQLFLPDGKPLPDGTFVSTGNPNYVIFVDDLDHVDVAREGARLERHSRFPQRCNIEFAQVLPAPAGESSEVGSIRTRVWERGSGITQACGTGACATAVAAVLTGQAERTTQIMMDGGTLSIEWRESDNHVYMTGPAAFVFDGEIELAKLQTT